MRLEYVDGGSAKFWEGERSGAAVTVRWGRIGTAGQVKARDFADDAAARAFLDKQVAEKTRKGYRETGVRPLEPVAEVRSAEPEPVEHDEDAFALSPGLAKQALPRRDRDPAKRRPDPKAEAAYDEFLLRYRKAVDAALTNPRTEPALRDAAQRYLAGDRQPLGAAAVAAAIGLAQGWQGRDALDVVGKGWVARHGVVFAVQACADLAAVAGQWESKAPHLRLRRPDEGLGSHWCGELAAMKVRSALAVADESAADALAERRATRAQRVVAAFLEPTETAWVDEACAEATGESASENMMLMCAVSTAAQFERIAPNITTWEFEREPRTLATLVAGVGPAIAPHLAGFLRNGSAEFTRKLLGVLAELPTDEAFDLLLDRIDEKYVQPVLLEAMKRYPQRAVRLLAARKGPRRTPCCARTWSATPTSTSSWPPTPPRSSRRRARRSGGCPTPPPTPCPTCWSPRPGSGRGRRSGGSRSPCPSRSAPNSAGPRASRRSGPRSRSGSATTSARRPGRRRSRASRPAGPSTTRPSTSCSAPPRTSSARCSPAGPRATTGTSRAGAARCSPATAPTPCPA
ncbi:WGR domain-containing protein [Actinokineospora soli]|uniref:WGR domain-containing protein n=1 Tax=Actinokineospora soli TaxID=1048753 RepID=A0ABW2TVA7_9PSEU